jgi:hypothetical protein
MALRTGLTTVTFEGTGERLGGQVGRELRRPGATQEEAEDGILMPPVERGKAVRITGEELGIGTHLAPTYESEPACDES